MKPQLKEGSEMALPDHPEFVHYFFMAIRQKNLKVLEGLLSIPMKNIDVLDENGMTGLEIAVTNGDTAIIKLLLSKSANINSQNKHGKTALLLAIELQKSEQLIRLLLENGANSELGDNILSTPLSCACLQQNWNVFKLLLEFNTNPNQIFSSKTLLPTPLENVVSKNQHNLTYMLLDRGAIFDKSMIPNDPPPVCNFAMWGRSRLVNGLWPKLNDETKRNVILHTIYGNKLDLLENLLKKSDDILIKSTFMGKIDGLSPLAYCIEHNRMSCVKILLEHGHDLLGYEPNNELSKKMILYKLRKPVWRQFLQQYYDNILKCQNTPTLLELAANVANRTAIETNIPFAELGLPPELTVVVAQAPIRFSERSTYLNAPHVKNFLEEALAMPPKEISKIKKQTRKPRRR